ncbi:hypothetical protein [Nostoc sp.]
MLDVNIVIYEDLSKRSPISINFKNALWYSVKATIYLKNILADR